MRTTQRFSPRSPTLEGKEAAGTGVVVLSGGNRVLVNIEVTALYIQNSQSHGKRNLSELDWCLETSCRADELWSRVLYIQEVLWKLNTNISRHSNKLCYRFFFFFILCHGKHTKAVNTGCKLKICQSCLCSCLPVVYVHKPKKQTCNPSVENPCLLSS